MFIFFFFKQKTAYEMRISDWSSDVCSSDLMAFNGTEEIPENELIHRLERLGLKFGADLNAATTFDQTFYRLDMPKNDDLSIDTGLHILRQQASAAIMDPGAIAEERGTIKGEERLDRTCAV